MKYDSQEARAVAGRLSAAASQLNSVAQGPMKRVYNDSLEAMEGEAGKALQQSVSELNRDLRALSTGVNSLAGQIQTFVRRMEIIDQMMND